MTLRRFEKPKYDRLSGSIPELLRRAISDADGKLHPPNIGGRYQAAIDRLPPADARQSRPRLEAVRNGLDYQI